MTPSPAAAVPASRGQRRQSRRHAGIRDAGPVPPRTRLLLADEQVDSLLVIFIPPLVTQADDVAQAIVERGGRYHEAGPRELHQRSRCAAGAGADSLVSVSRGRCDGACAGDRVWRLASTSQGHRFRTLHGHSKGCRARGHGRLRSTRGDGWLTPVRSADACRGGWAVHRFSKSRRPRDEDAVGVAREIGYPVALKAAGPEILHKSDVGGVILDFADETHLRAAFPALRSRVGDAMTGGDRAADGAGWRRIAGGRCRRSHLRPARRLWQWRRARRLARTTRRSAFTR